MNLYYKYDPMNIHIINMTLQHILHNKIFANLNLDFLILVFFLSCLCSRQQINPAPSGWRVVRRWSVDYSGKLFNAGGEVGIV